MEIYVPIKIPVLRGHTKIELFDHDEIHRMEPKYVQEKPNAIQDEFIQQRGYSKNKNGETGDVRALRKKGVLENPLSGPQEVSQNGDETGSGSSFYGDE